MRQSIVQSFTFHAAHKLPWHTGRCANLHGHTYRLDVEIAGDLDENGTIIDFDHVAPVVSALVLDRLDHTDLNLLFQSPTAENIAAWIFEQVEAEFPGLSRVRLWETPESSAVVER